MNYNYDNCGSKQGPPVKQTPTFPDFSRKPPMISPFHPKIQGNPRRNWADKVYFANRNNSFQPRMGFHDRAQLKTTSLTEPNTSRNQQENWSNFRENRNECTNIYQNAQKQYIKKQSDSMETSEICNKFQSNMNTENNSSQVSNLSCDSCDRDFPSTMAFNKHMSEHKICGLDGCTFTAHEKIIEKHIQMQHSTGIYERMKNTSDAKWREERKNRYPTKENLEKRTKEQEELWKKGIRIGERQNKFGRDKTRLERKHPQIQKKDREAFFLKKKEKHEKMIAKLQPKEIFDDKFEYCCGIAPFTGTKELFEEYQEELFKISDDEDDIVPLPIKNKATSEGLGALMAYGSDCSEDDEGPLEIKFVKTKEPTEINKNVSIKKNNTELDKNEATKKNNKNRLRSKNNKRQFPYEFKRRKITQLDALLDEDIRKERNIILQFVRNTIENNYYDKA